MNHHYVILSDAACDLERGVMKQENLEMIAMEYIQDTEIVQYTPTDSVQPIKKFYDAQRNGSLAKTSQIPPKTYEDVMRPWLERGFSVLYLALSSGLSSTYQTACAAGEKMQKQYPGLRIIAVDTKAATGGMGILTERAVRNRAAGMTISENAQNLCKAVGQLHHWFLVQDLKYLQQGGRISAATAMVGTVFRIHPILEIDSDGRLQTIGKARGKHKAMRELLDHYEAFRTDSCADPVYVIDADAPEIGNILQQKLLERHPELTIRRCTLSPIIGAHTGPGMAAIIHIGR
ncbi:MAG: DegV family protein [Clostridia bacterium]|nr:DegV family protein [Clostridia bacterium]